MKLSKSLFSILFLVLLTVTIGRDKTIFAQTDTGDRGSLINVNITGSISGDTILFNVYLPAEYSSEGEGFPVIYNLHGRGGQYDGRGPKIFQAAIERAIADDILPPVIAVFTDGTKSGWYADSKDGSILIETHIIREVLPWIDRNLNTKASKEYRVIQGMSMGGYGASLFAVKFPELFSVCINYDGAMWNWETMTRQSGKWPPVAPFMFDNDQAYYDRNSSPWTFAEVNRDKIKGQVRFRTLVGSLGGGSTDTQFPGLEGWRDHLSALGIEMEYIETGCAHNLVCLHERAAEGSFRLIAEQFKNAGLSSAPARNRNPRIVSPEIHPDRTVTFRLIAPEAAVVKVNIPYVVEGEPMIRDENGLWSITIGPVETPDLYTYWFIVDGIRVLDHNNPFTKTNERNKSSLLDIPGDNPLIHDVLDVPHGNLHLRYYQSSALGTTRRMVIYTPPGYESDTDISYPVLYLFHGTTDFEDTWVTVGRANLIADNLLAEKKTKPMIIVMPYGRAYPVISREAGSLGYFENIKYFSQDLFEGIIPYVESNFRVLNDRENRAVAGLSGGGGEALAIGLSNPEKFAWICGFSAAIRENEFQHNYGISTDHPEETNENLRLLWIGCGTDDHLYEVNTRLIEMLKEKNIKHVSHITDGGHTFMNWRAYLHEILQLLFK